MRLALPLVLVIALTGCTQAQINDMNRGLERRQAERALSGQPRSKGNPYNKWQTYQAPAQTTGFVPLPPVDMSPPQSTPRTYMINTPQGIEQRTCQNTNSPYSYCY